MGAAELGASGEILSEFGWIGMRMGVVTTAVGVGPKRSWDSSASVQLGAEEEEAAGGKGAGGEKRKDL